MHLNGLITITNFLATAITEKTRFPNEIGEGHRSKGVFPRPHSPAAVRRAQASAAKISSSVGRANT
jgi:hypothetical protein